MKASKPIDLQDAGITELQLIPTVSPGKPSKGEFDIRWRSPKLIESGVVCRVESYNLAFFAEPDLDESLDKGQHSVFWHPDPFVLDPDICEVRFVDAHRNTLASACYRAGNMTEGPCPAGTFPPPKLDAGQVLDIQGASIETITNGTTRATDAIAIKALYTVAAPLEHVSFDATCDGAKSEREPPEELVPLDRLRPGETVFARDLVIHFARPLAKAPPASCELHAARNGKPLGTFCIHEGSTERGRCSP